MTKRMTKKQLRQSAVGGLIAALLLASIAGALAFWDYREQKNFYNFWKRGSGLDFKTGKPIPNYQPPPFKYSIDRSAFLPFIIVSSAIALLFMFVGISEFRKFLKITETPEMRVTDARREVFENSPEVKRSVRRDVILRLLRLSLLVPVPFIAIYKFGAVVFAVYITFVAIIIGASHYIVPRWIQKS